jgi:O2-independent ubiquinone biosynthesis protein UbiU
MPPSTADVPPRVELVCPAGTLAALQSAVDSGADAVYFGFRDGSNARNFPGLNFSMVEAEAGITYAHENGVRAFIAINIHPDTTRWRQACAAVDAAAELQTDALILADLGLLQYAANRYPDLPLHLSVQASATNRKALEFYRQRFNIRRAVLPRVLALPQIARLVEHDIVDIEVFGFGSLCVMAEGRCALSSYATGQSPNAHGVCSPAHAVRWGETPRGREARLNGVLIDRYAPGEPAGYPTLCKGRFSVTPTNNGERLNELRAFHALEEPTALNVVDILPALIDVGVKAIKIEGRQRNAAYVGQVTRLMRAAVNTTARPSSSTWTGWPKAARTRWALITGRGSNDELHANA